jgi:hypothetical protein
MLSCRCIKCVGCGVGMVSSRIGGETYKAFEYRQGDVGELTSDEETSGVLYAKQFKIAFLVT